ncbi:PSD1 domain-containing protein [Telmatocola sphagniphila]|uniref:PSD1 domain-containing protein n=1 Tax=Telmatocola sphagniphila TaxID=1123043 RepID=A0A8E6B9C2_9BACT|nr:PSD1 and planctomycete cytochrome C domain-containing protein [Telmatocola sphagniphila]QVL34141.1 PSD1 domain-containing protein [Telmatocola sphagniphila]
MRHPLAVITAAFVVITPVFGAEPEPAKLDFFEKKVRPILVEHCHACHSADTKPAGGLRVDDRNGLLNGGNTGPAVIPGNPDKSLILKRVTAKNKGHMPQQGEDLKPQELADLTQWIREGALWPTIRVPGHLGKTQPSYEKLKKEHWAWQPLSRPEVPVVKNKNWPKDDLDRFVLSRLEAANLQPAAEADKLSLLRRVTFDLTGLPPSPADIDSFVNDFAPDAFAKVVDRLLASPQFGERWGRHWLDVARYGESTGPSRNIPYPFSWKYRDYVIDSVNADVPFDRFLREQIAGDLLPADNSEQQNRQLTATGFLALGVKDVNQRFKVRFLMDNVDEQIDAVSRSILALTVSCARCHDHKFDPIPQSDYYALAGIFTSSENAAGVRSLMGGGGLAYYDPANLVVLKGNLPEVPKEQVEKVKAELAEAKKAWDAIRGTPEGLKLAANGFPTQRPFRLKFEAKQAELAALTDPAARGFAVHGAREGKVVGDTELRIRGEAEKLGPKIPRGFLTAWTVPDAPSIPASHSGRLELAQWLTSNQNPVTPRVAVNRVWAHLFGRGIVSTVDNFGVTGDLPSHPELLDFLANRFLQEGWSVKKLVREIALSRTYQLSAETSQTARKLDPANKLLWCHSPRRLDAEEYRDAALFSAGKLDSKRLGPSAVSSLKMIEMRDNGPEAKAIHEAADRSRARSIYLPLLRGVTPHALAAFDPVEQTLVTGIRESTTVPSQALFLLNSAFVANQSLSLADRLLKDSNATDSDRISLLYRRTLSRTPTDHELTRALAFVADYEAAAKLQPPPPEPPKVAKKVEPKKPVDPNQDPDTVDQTGENIAEEIVHPKDAKTAAWQALVQSVLGSAEFRYLK